MTRRYLTIPAVAAALGLGAFARAADSQPTTAELIRQIEQLQAKVAQMERNQQSVNTQVVDQTVERVLRDADKRSQLMQVEGFNAGWSDGRFMLGSADGRFTMRPFVQLQVRNSTNFDTGGNENTENGFSLPRAKFGVDGKAFTDWEYMFLWNAGDSDGGASGPLNLEQAWVKYQAWDELAFRAGQFVDPVSHEQLTASQFLMASDRSLMNLIIFGADESYTQGVTAIFTMDRLTVEGGFTDGVNTGNTSFRDFPTSPTNFGFAGRVEYVLNGAVANYRDFTAMGNKEDLLVIGGGGDWTQAGDTNNLLHTVDVQWENTEGLGIYAAYLGQFIMNGGGSGLSGITGGTEDSYNWGFLVQANYMLNDQWEVFGRYNYTGLEEELTVGTAGETEDTFHELTGGVNYYFHGHNAKFTLDVSYLPQGAPVGADGLGILSSEDDQFVIRGQIQFML
jgi:hypothetical protein